VNGFDSERVADETTRTDTARSLRARSGCGCRAAFDRNRHRPSDGIASLPINNMGGDDVVFERAALFRKSRSGSTKRLLDSSRSEFHSTESRSDVDVGRASGSKRRASKNKRRSTK
jgi:hypothetical protein